MGEKITEAEFLICSPSAVLPLGTSGFAPFLGLADFLVEG